MSGGTFIFTEGNHTVQKPYDTKTNHTVERATEKLWLGHKQL